MLVSSPEIERLRRKLQTEGGIMIPDVGLTPSRRPMRSRLRYGKRHLQGEIRVELFQAAFMEFTSAAEAFAVGLSDEQHRNFAFRYLKYLQDVAQGTNVVKPNEFGLGPAARLIRAELDRLFDLSFLSTDGMIAA